MTVIKEYNAGTGQWETIVVGKQGPAGADGNGTSYYGQMSSQTAQTVSIVSQGAYVPMAISGTFDTGSSFGTVAPTTATFGVKNDSGSTQLFTVIATADVEIGNNKTAGFRMAVNGVAVPETTCTATTGTQNFAKLLSQWMVELDDGDEVSLLVANLSSTDDIDVDRSKVVVFTAGRQGEAGVVQQTSPPSNTSLLWIDTDDSSSGPVIPVGGSTGQVLAKASGTDYDTEWIETQARAVLRSSAGDAFFGVPNASLLSSGTLAMAGARPVVWIAPFHVRYAITISELSYQITSIGGAAPQTLDLAVSIYDADAEWQSVGSARLLATTNHTAAGITTVTGLSTTLQPGRYVTELLLTSAVNFPTMRMFGVDTPGAAAMDFGNNPQNAGRYLVGFFATTGDEWSAANSVSGGGIMHAVLYKWSLA